MASRRMATHAAACGRPSRRVHRNRLLPISAPMKCRSQAGLTSVDAPQDEVIWAYVSARILQAEGLGLVVVGEGLRKAGPSHDGAQCLLGRFRDHVIFELVEEAALRGGVVGAV